jgi:hypothetical protein
MVEVRTLLSAASPVSQAGYLYDVRRYLSGAGHGSILITTRLARLEQLGDAQQMGKVNDDQAEAILESWYRKKHGKPRAVNWS